MLGRYPVTIGGETRGELQVSKDGAVWLFEAEAEDPGGLLRLSVYGEGREGYLGVMSPGRGGRVKLRKRLSRTDLRGFPEKIEYAAPAGQLAVEAGAGTGRASADPGRGRNALVLGARRHAFQL